ncbi:MAG: response regulator [Planctomycetaceae bacterium]
MPTILCVDDDPCITRSIEIHLSNYEVNVKQECCGRLGFWDVFDLKPDLIISDINMPDGDGVHFLQQLKSNSQTAHIPVLILTGRRDPQLKGRMKNLGAAAFLNKPVHFDLLLKEIRRHISFKEIDWSSKDKPAEQAD